MHAASRQHALRRGDVGQAAETEKLIGLHATTCETARKFVDQALAIQGIGGIGGAESGEIVGIEGATSDLRGG